MRQMIEPIWCSFCEDRPIAGTMLLVVDGTQDVVGKLPPEQGGACGECGKSYTGAVVGENEETGQVGVLQFEHFDYEKVKDRLDEFPYEQWGKCQVCGETWEIERWVVEKIARQDPQVITEGDISARATCGRCTSLGLCPCCGEEEHE